MTVGGIVLAGGRSTRMGRSKALLEWHGLPLVAHVAGQVAAAVDGPVIVVAAPGQELPDLPHAIVRDPVEGRGPLQGLAVGLDALEADVAFVCATDQPFAAEIVDQLLAALTGADDAVAYEGQPLGALYRTRLATTAQERLATDGSLKGLLGAVTTRTLPGAPAALRSLDTPEQYHREM